jgi:hypothetical protein
VDAHDVEPSVEAARAQLPGEQAAHVAEVGDLSQVREAEEAGDEVDVVRRHGRGEGTAAARVPAP